MEIWISVSQISPYVPVGSNKVTHYEGLYQLLSHLRDFDSAFSKCCRVSFWSQRLNLWIQITFKHRHTYCIFFWIAHFDPEQVVQKPVYGLIFIEHEKKFHYEWQVFWFKQFSWKQDKKVHIQICLLLHSNHHFIFISALNTQIQFWYLVEILHRLRLWYLVAYSPTCCNFEKISIPYLEIFSHSQPAE